MPQRLWAEFLGTFWLVLGGAGSAVLAGTVSSTDGFPVGIGNLGVALAFGLSVVTAAYAFGHISGGHFNPAVTLGLWAAKRIESRAVLPYIVAQLLGGSLAGLTLFAIASGQRGFDPVATGFATNGYGPLSPGHYSMGAVALTEIVLTAIFVWVILGVTSNKAPRGFAPLAIGLTLTLIHLISIPVDNTSVNPARSLAVVWYAGAGPLSQVWLFIVMPIIGALIAGFSYRYLTGDKAGYLPTDDVADAAATQRESTYA